MRGGDIPRERIPYVGFWGSCANRASGVSLLSAHRSSSCLTPRGAGVWRRREQAAKTYLERKFETFEEATLDELIQHALTALKESCTEGDLNSKNCSLAVVGLDRPLEILEDDAIQPYITAMEADGTDAAMDAEVPAAEGAPAPTPMEES